MLREALSLVVNEYSIVLSIIPFFSVVEIEPVGLKAPKFSSDSSSSTYTKRQNIDIALQCNSQGSPAPISR